MKNVILSRFLDKVFETPEDEKGVWFGYYNYDTLNKAKNRLLCNKTGNDGIAVEKGMSVEIGYYDVQTGEWTKLGDSDSYNWPQGSMAQWLPDEAAHERVIYNLSKDNHIVSRIIDTSTGEERYLNYPIYGIMPKGDKSLTLNFERSYWCRAYHYESVANKEYDMPIIPEDGVFEVDLKTGEKKLILSLKTIMGLDSESDFPQMQHWLEHVMISPSGKRFVVLHRFSPIGDVYHYETRMIIANTDGTDAQVVPGWRDFNWSHFGWNGDNAFAMYSVQITGAQKALTNSMKKPSNGKVSFVNTVKRGVLSFLKRNLPSPLRRYMKGNRSGYQYFELKDGKFELTEYWQGKNLDIDGHPSFTKDGRYMVTDSYPDAEKYRRLIVFDRITHKSIIAARLYAGLYETPAKCDLHPKLCKDNNLLVVDTAYPGKHKMIVFKLNWEEIKKELS